MSQHHDSVHVAPIRNSAAGRSIRQLNRASNPMSPTKRSDSDGEPFAITKDEVRKTFAAFIAALSAGDYQTLRELYDEDYLLVRPDGAVLGKSEILNDLKEHSMVLSGFETQSTSRIFHFHS